MRILVFSSMPHDLDAGSPIRGRTIVNGLRNAGIQVVVLSSSVKGELSGENFFNFTEYDSLEGAFDSVIGIFKPDIVYSITHGLLDITARVCDKHNIPLALDLHAIRSLELFSERYPLNNWWQLFTQAIKWEQSIRKAKLITVCSPMLYYWVHRIFKQSIPVIGISDSSFFNLPLLEDKDTIKVLYAGNLMPYQGWGLFIESLSKLPSTIRTKVNCTLIGTMWGNALDNSATKFAIESGMLNLQEPVPYTDYPSLLKCFDVFVVPRPWSLATYLAIPQKMVDALSAGRCVIATDIAPHRYAIKNLENGLLCKATSRSLAKAIELSIDGKLRKKISKNARDLSTEKYCMQTQINVILKYFSTTLK